MHALEVIRDPAVAAVALDPTRSSILAAVADPTTATAVAARLGLSRQLVNHHLKALERAGLVELVQTRRKGNMTERVVRARARGWAISPDALGAAASAPLPGDDRLSARWILALASRLLSECARLVQGAEATRRPLATLGFDSEVRFASADDRTAFAQELTGAVTALVSRYHSPDGRPHRLVLAVHPIPRDADDTDDTVDADDAEPPLTGADPAPAPTSTSTSTEPNDPNDPNAPEPNAPEPNDAEPDEPEPSNPDTGAQP